ncbi:MAG: three-Cys-motif partner protein TcmP [Bacteroidetes bacterium]|jgi:three-Cys-motif partner protein|nr:three-Cys-motif partner protein TcmP [Bacteroidota bacterium]
MSGGTRHLFGGDWTQEKLRMLEKYLSAYATIMQKQPFDFAYIDAFAGTGYLQEEGDSDQPSLFPTFEAPEREFLQGSVRTALDVEPELDTYIFIEKDNDKFAELQQIGSEYPEKDVRFINEDANAWLLERCHERDWTKHRAVVFLDPFGMQVPWETVQAIADTEAIDLWILFPLGIGANRLLTRNGEIPPGWEARLNAVFGTEAWKERFYEDTPTLFDEKARQKVIDIEGIGRFYNDRLGEEFAMVADNPRYLHNSRGNPLYLLCFAAANPKGAPTAVKIAQHILRG